MVAPLNIGPGIDIGAGVGIGAFGAFYNKTTQTSQNVAGSNGAIRFFFQGGAWATTPTPSYYDIEPGWTVVGLPGATVVSTDPGTQTVTITGGVFVSGASYAFTGV